MKEGPIPILFSGGMNNQDAPLSLFLNKKGEVPLLINADTSRRGRLKLLRPLTALNTPAEASSIHSIYRGKGSSIVLVGTGAYLKYLNGTALTTLLDSLATGNMSFAHAGNWVYLCNGTDKKAVYLLTPVGTDWGQAIPTAAPTVADSGNPGNPDGTYQCYYRYKITLPDDSIIYTDLSAVDEVTVVTNQISWSNIVHATFVGATTCQAELFRTATGLGGTFLVTTLDSGTTTYSDDLSDAALQAKTAFAETGYYPPPSNPNLAFYHPGADRVFVAKDNNVYWSEVGLYHTFLYSAAAGEYSNINSVFLNGENITGLCSYDEQLYIGCQRTWRRLRGTSPTYWTWEDTSAIKGPVSWSTVAETPWGIVYVGNDGYIWLFNGDVAIKISEHFVFDTDPTATAHASFDGRFYRLYYGDSTYPELVLDFHGFYSIPPRITKSTRTATASHYDPASNMFYMGTSDGYLKNGEDTSQSVTLTLRTAEVPAEDLAKVGNLPSLLLHANTGGDNLTITPYHDDVAQDALTPFISDSLIRDVLALDLGTYRALSLQISITTSQDIELREPWLIKEEEG